MTRRVDDPVEVRVTGGQDATPTSFLWRNRLYVVREVLGHWRERCEWWNGSAARAVHGDTAADTAAVGAVGAVGAGRGAAAAGVVSSAAAVQVMDQEQEMWRVEASPGRSFGSGVYDLSRSAGSPVPGQGWRLVRVAD
jgi:hypothetical protein